MLVESRPRLAHCGLLCFLLFLSAGRIRWKEHLAFTFPVFSGRSVPTISSLDTASKLKLHGGQSYPRRTEEESVL